MTIVDGCRRDEDVVETTTALERAIDWMADESAGGCFDPDHFHSFQSVSSLLPRSCAGCGRRIQMSSALINSSNSVVRCAACGVYAHRNCAFSKDTHWQELCCVNYANPTNKEDTAIDHQSDNICYASPTGETVGQSDRAGPDKGSMKTSGMSNPFRSISKLGGWLQQNDSSLEIRGNEEIPRDAPAMNNGIDDEIPLRTGPSALTSIFRKPLNKESHPGSCDEDNQNCQRPIRMTASEDGAMDRGKFRGSKANFPFLSASRLLPSKQLTEACRLSQNPTHTLPQSQTWDTMPATMPNEKQKVDMIEEQSKCREAEFSARKSVHYLPGESITDCSNATDTNQEFSEATSESDVAKHPPPSMFNSTMVHISCDDKGKDVPIRWQWTASGPPSHWATKQTVDEISASSKRKKEDVNFDGDESNTSSVEQNSDSSLHFTSHPFASVSSALHENILEQFRPVVSRYLQKDDIPATNDNKNSLDSEATEKSGVEGLLEESTPEDDPSTKTQRVGLATVAGGIAGGVVGLAFAGPLGGVIGAKAGQTAGILGILWEGSVTVGVVASGVAAGMNTGQQLQDKLEAKRVLALGEEGKRRVLLIRPTIKIDTIWSEIYAKERQSFKSGLPFNLLLNEATVAKRERYEREVDIVKTAEEEIPTEDKVFLLVSRILNNKESLPGHVYRCLLQRLIQRSEDRGPVQAIFHRVRKVDETSGDVEEEVLDLSCARRQDAHAVIKYVTATLLEVRPGFGVSPNITELTASAVEALVFGEIYGLIIEEIEADYEEQDNALLEKIAEFERIQAKSDGDDNDYKTCVSEPALSALHQLPQSHSAVDKLRCCVNFLERISDFYSTCAVDNKYSMGADSLLKMVCQHILVAKVFGINAQIAFLEEFARDEQLLRGKEGYTLVTLQASLHFLNASNNFEKDIFVVEDDC